MDPADIPRQLGDLMRLAVVDEVDLAAARCTVRVGDDLVTGPLPWLAGRAGNVLMWSPPSVGEQVLLLCPEADVAAGLVLPGLFCSDHPAPSAEPMFLIRSQLDGAEIAYDPATQALTATLPAGGTAAITAPGGLTIVGDVTLTGTLNASGDVVANGISLHDHKHGQVKAGADVSGAPQ